MEKENVRFYIKVREEFFTLSMLECVSFALNNGSSSQVRHALGADALTIYEELRQYAGDQAPSHSTVKRWCKLFRRGREQLVDDPRSGRPYSRPTSLAAVSADCCLNLVVNKHHDQRAYVSDVVLDFSNSLNNSFSSSSQ